jgi:hypothetical protein
MTSGYRRVIRHKAWPARNSGRWAIWDYNYLLVRWKIWVGSAAVGACGVFLAIGLVMKICLFGAKGSPHFGYIGFRAPGQLAVACRL